MYMTYSYQKSVEKSSFYIKVFNAEINVYTTMPKFPFETRKNLENENIETLFSMCTLTPSPWGLTLFTA